MVKVDLPYGRSGHQQIELDHDRFLGVIRPMEVEVRDEEGTINDSLDSPLGCQDIAAFLQGGKDIVFIVNDGTRPTPTAKVLDALSARFDLSQARFLIATGTHRPPTEEELGFIFAGHLDGLRDRIHAHDSLRDPCVMLGVSKNGTEMEVNEMAVKADRLVIITSVEPHYFAGYTGGRKSFLPGVASYRSVEQNHRLAMRPEAKVLALDGNPVHEDMIDALDAVKDLNVFSIQVVMDRHQRVYRVASGDLFQAFDLAVDWANEVFVADIEERADVVVTVAPYPMDVDLYQSQKAIENGKLAVKDGGVVILVSKCREGIGGEAFYRQLSASRDPKQILENLRVEYKLGYHKAAKLAELMDRAELYAVTGLPCEALERINVTPFRCAQEALDHALAARPGGKVLVMLDGSVTVPRLV
jgi:nickel-dependent lactate racemase